MSCKKAIDVLPAHLLEEVQKYAEGCNLYIPKSSKRRGWGSVSGAKSALQTRNAEILNGYLSGKSIVKLANEYYLSEETIKKIVYGHKKTG